MTLLEEALALLRRVYEEEHSGRIPYVELSCELSDDIADFLELPKLGPVPGSIAERLVGETMSELHIARNFTLPVESVAQTFGILAVKGSGKSNAAVVLAEEMWEAGIPWVAVDPKGDWFGIRSSRDGKHPGLALPVFGGIHGDVPLHADGGALLADLIIDIRLTCVVDVSEFSKGEQTRFLVDMADRLFRRQRRSPEPMHLFLEEAHEYLPQRVMRDQAVLVGLWSRIVKQGRSFGLGVTVISQRSASLNKDVLTQIGTLIVLRTLSPQDRKAIKDWVEEYDVDREMLLSLPSLEDGEAWIWSPQFLKTFKRIKFRQRHTFDSGATPKLGQIRKPATIAEIDLGAIEEQWSASIERAKESDPRELKKRVRELERELANRPIETQVEDKLVDVPIPVLPDGFAEDILLTRKSIDRMSALLETMDSHIQELNRERVEKVVRVKPPEGSRVATKPTQPDRGTTTPQGASGPGDLPKMQRKILTVLAQHGTRTTEQLLLQTGYKVGGSWHTTMAELRKNQLFESRGSGYDITRFGLTALGDLEPLPSGPALRDYWKNELGQMAARIIDALDARSPLTIDDLLEATGYKVGGSWHTAMARLRKLNIITGNPVRLTDEFLEATS